MKKAYLKERVKGIIIGMAIMMVFSFVSNDSIASTMKKSIEVLYSDIKIVIDGVKITPKDGKGEVVEPFIYKGTTYLPVRAISEGLGQQVDWEQKTKTVYIGEKPKATYNSVSAEEFVKKHEPYRGNSLIVYGPGKVQIRQEDYNYYNQVKTGYNTPTYLVNGNYTKIKGVFLRGDNNEGGSSLMVTGDGNEIFDSGTFLKERGFKNGWLERGDKNQPVEFEVDITGVEELQIRSGDIFNVEFIGIK